MNEFEIAGRLRKAEALVRAAQAEQMVKIDLEMMDQAGWKELAEKAEVKMPSEKTQRVATALMPKEEMA